MSSLYTHSLLSHSIAKFVMQKIVFCGRLVLILAFFSGCDKEKVSEDAQITLGRELFHDTRFSSSGEQSCATCHPDGHTDNRKWHFPAIHDSSSGKPDSLKTLTLWGIAQTGPPYLWSGRTTGLYEITKLYTDTIMGGLASHEELEALVAYQKSLVAPSNPWIRNDGELTMEQQRGKKIYETKGFCSPCHPAPTGTNGFVKDIGTGGFFKTPSLIAMYSKSDFFHDGRAKTLRDVIHFYIADPENKLRDHDFIINLSDQEISDLIEYLKSF
ncbi:c-type cytochrome [bacterium]|nr:c-type cytochrome [bacterium]